MKKITIIIITILTSLNIGISQSTNWQSDQNDQNSVIYYNMGFEFAMIARIGYGHKINAKRPLLLITDLTIPMGDDLIDDLKFRVGGQMQILRKNNIAVTATLFAIARRHQTNLVKQIGFGSESAISLGYYKPKWHIATEFGFDKSIVTHLDHSDVMSDNYPGLRDAWYTDAGGQYYYGIQASRKINTRMKIDLRLGKTDAQGDHTNALLPVYFQIGFEYSLKRNTNR